MTTTAPHAAAPMTSSPGPAGPGGPGGPPPIRQSLITTIAPFITLAVIIGMVVFVTHKWEYWTGEDTIQQTDNAYVKADITALKAKVGGFVKFVYPTDYAAVEAGSVIVEIADEDYKVALASAEASLASAKATLDNTDNEIALQHTAIVQAQAAQTSAEAVLQRASLDLARQKSLSKQQIIATQTVETAEASYLTAAADVKKAIAAVEYERRQLDVLSGQRRQRQALVDAAQAAVDSARLDIRYTKVIAPFDGVVSSRAVQPGDHITAGTQVISIVPLPHVYIVANYKETQLTHVEEGQPVSIEVDSFPGVELHGRVERIAPATGSEFALLPADNATGNFTKVVQRISVRIDLDPAQPMVNKIRAGMSVISRIETTGEKIAPYQDLHPLRKIREMGGTVNVRVD